MREQSAALIICADGREICRPTPDGKMLYIMRRFVAWVKQGKRCALCLRPLLFHQATSDHASPRKMGGGERDDRQENIRAACWICNSEKGSRR